MKQIRSLINGLVASGIALAMVSSLTAQTVMDGSAKVVRVSGPARFTTGNNMWQPLKAGDILKPGTIVQTGKEKGSFIDIVLNESNPAMPKPAAYNPHVSASSSSSSYQPSASQNVVRVFENSALGIDKLTSQQTGNELVTETQLDLRAGRITGQVKKMSAASKYEIKLPNGVAGIRGTAFDITADGVVKVYEGSVVIAIVKTDANGNRTVDTQVVNAGWQYDSRTSKLSQFDNTSAANVVPEYITGGTPTVISVDRTIFLESSTTTGH